MAEHILTLKAQLDSSQVQQQLNQMNGNNATGNMPNIGNQLNQVMQQFNKLAAQLNKFGQTLDKAATQTEQAARTQATAGNAAAEAFLKSKLFKFATGAAVQKVTGGIADYYTATGNNEAANRMKSLQSIAGGVAMGYAVGGPVGMAIGGAVAAFDDAVRNFAAAIADYKAGVEKSKTFATTVNDIRREETFANLVNAKNTGGIANLLNSARERRDQLKAKYGNWGPEQYSKAIAAAESNATFSVGDFYFDAYGKVEDKKAKVNEFNNQAVAAAAEYKKLTADIKKYEAAINAITTEEQRVKDAAAAKEVADKKAAQMTELAAAEKLLAEQKAKEEANYKEGLAYTAARRGAYEDYLNDAAIASKDPRKIATRARAYGNFGREATTAADFNTAVNGVKTMLNALETLKGGTAFSIADVIAGSKSLATEHNIGGYMGETFDTQAVDDVAMKQQQDIAGIFTTVQKMYTSMIQQNMNNAEGVIL